MLTMNLKRKTKLHQKLGLCYSGDIGTYPRQIFYRGYVLLRLGLNILDFWLMIGRIAGSDLNS